MHLGAASPGRSTLLEHNVMLNNALAEECCQGASCPQPEMTPELLALQAELDESNSNEANFCASCKLQYTGKLSRNVLKKFSEHLLDCSF